MRFIKKIFRGIGSSALARLGRDESGVSAIEFSILAIPFFLMVFAIIETFIAFGAEQLLNYGVDKIGRQLRTGEITFNTGEATDINEDEFKLLFCGTVSLMIDCKGTYGTRLFLDVRSFDNFNDIPIGVPRVGNAKGGDLDTSEFDFAPGEASSVNIVRAYFKWQVMTDLIRPYLSNIDTSDGSLPQYYLMVATTAFRNEAYDR